MINSLPKFFDSHTILAFSPPVKTFSFEGEIISIKGPSILNSFFETPLKDPSKFSIFIKQLLLFTEETSQLYSPSFSVIANNSQSYPEFEEK